MNQKKYQQLKNKIIEAVPEIMNLKFGCKFEIKNENYKEEKKEGLFDYFIVNNKEWKRGNKRYLDYTVFGGIQNGWQGQMRTKDLEDIEIIGRPITLEDVLVALNKNRPLTKSGYIDAIDSSGEFITICGNDEPWARQPQIKWQLNKPLEKQSDETKEFLYNLLIKK